MEQGPTWFVEREEGFQTLVSRPLSIPRDDGTTAAPLWILRDNGSKEKKLYRMKALREKGKEWAWGKTESQKSEKEGKISLFISLRIIKSRPLDYVQYKSTTGDLETRSTIGIKDRFKILNQ